MTKSYRSPNVDWIRSTTVDDDIDSSDNTASIDKSDDAFIPMPVRSSRENFEKVKPTTSTTELFTPHVTAALDRNKTSDREALRLMVPIAAALGHDPSCLPLSRRFIQRMRQKARRQHAELALDSFVPEHPLVVHWDGKICPKIIGEGKVDRLPVLVSGDGFNKLLGVPKLASGEAQNAAKAVFDQLNHWGIVDKVQAMCFDTTSLNTGRFKGVCTVLEEKIGHELLWWPCRHHIME